MGLGQNTIELDKEYIFRVLLGELAYTNREIFKLRLGTKGYVQKSYNDKRVSVILIGIIANIHLHVQPTAEVRTPNMGIK